MQNDFGFYIHWPYCLSKCPYCDFFSVAHTPPNEKVLEQAYARDIALIPHTQTVTSIFFGGGTPCLMSCALVEHILHTLSAQFQIAPDVEISMEVNPDAINTAKMQDFKAAGVNRLSIGVQALDSASLTFLGRRHSLQTAINCISQATKVFDNVSIDLMYARPHQTSAQWAAELDKALAFGLPHYSLYQLTIENGTPFARRGITGADEELSRILFLETLEKMARAGYLAYEVSNFAKTGYTCRHNQTYWRGFDYAGIGAAAHGRLGMTATENPAHIGDWLAGKRTVYTLTPTEKAEESLILGLRSCEGVLCKNLAPKAVLKALHNHWIEQKGDRLIPTPDGWLMLNQLTLLLAQE